MKTFWEIEKDADALLRANGFKTKRFGTRVKFNPHAPENQSEPVKGENHYESNKVDFERRKMMKSQQVKQEIKQKRKTDEKLA